MSGKWIFVIFIFIQVGRTTFRFFGSSNNPIMVLSGDGRIIFPTPQEQ